MPTREHSKSLYRYLETAFDAGEFVVRDSGVSGPRGDIHHAVDPTGKRILMIPVTEDEFDAFEDDSAGTAVILRKERYSSGHGDLNPYLVFRCESEALINTFASFVDDVLDEFENAASDKSASGIAIVVLKKWRRLFATRGPSILRDKPLVGLAAELRVLESVVEARGAGALDSWIGPDGADHDFVLENCSIEVKATLKKTGLEVEINGVGQLEPTAEGPLYLAASRATFTPNGSATLPGLVDALLERGVDGAELTRKLEAVGYHHSRADEYAKRRVEFVEERFFKVVENFPRIDRSTLAEISQADRIRRVSYLLDLTDHSAVSGAMSVADLGGFMEEVL